ncbi:MAG: sensor histidine kinase [Thermoanaerobaculia bacterium]
MRPTAAASRDTTGLPRKRAIILLRYGLLIAAAYVLLAHTGFGSPSAVLGALIFGGLASNLLLHRLPAYLFESTTLTAVVIVADTVAITGALLYSGGFSTDFFFVYFFILFIAAIGENISSIALGAVVIAGGYLYALTRGDGSAISSTASLIRLPFLFMVATFYGYLVDRVRRERQRTHESELVVDRLEAAQRDLSERATELERTSRRLESEVAERRQAEERLERANQKLKKVSKRKSDFISTVSHELRTPLTSIKNAVDLLSSGRAGEVGPPQQRFLGMASRNINRLAQIIDDLLDLSKIEAGQLEYRFREVDVPELLDEVTQRFRSEAEERSLELELSCPAELPKAWVDPHRIDQVLTNLLGNALKFTPAGGRIEVRAQHLDNGIEVRIADTGVGLSPEEQERVFDRFYQVEDPLTRKCKGSGLGLSICRRLLAAHGSTLSLESAPGEGSSFFTVLPEASAESAEVCAFERLFEQHQGQADQSSVLVVRRRQHTDEAADSCQPIAWLEALHQVVREQLPRMSDQVVAQPANQQLVIVLAMTARSGAEVVKQRLARLLEKASERGELAPTEILGPATSPDDGASGQDLIARATQSA